MALGTEAEELAALAFFLRFLLSCPSEPVQLASPTTGGEPSSKYFIEDFLAH